MINIDAMNLNELNHVIKTLETLISYARFKRIAMTNKENKQLRVTQWAESKMPEIYDSLPTWARWSEK